ncbi:MAG: 2-C-methyl-D-erythritol 2,4-cyclodiphosphate synthase [Cytophagales bacterium]|nr:2-C-methyl-D-erythritol 2,4-cyclodiphosphate synthase [Cytophagales bacterium]MDW8384131.1 2-C-methyl-D-erythritol 2,4-cyclodiphosphate synthase [Flammeovirgaceae bacterium]
MSTFPFRIGYGYDVHPLEEGKEFWLGGVQIAHTHGAVGHSDADVLIHAICDALLGAANLRDIGHHFPPSDPRFKGIDSKILLKNVVHLLHQHEYVIGNVDATVCLQEPKIKPYIPQMQEILASILKIDTGCVSIKATTTEKMGFVGRKEGIEAHAVALIYLIL